MNLEWLLCHHCHKKQVRAVLMEGSAVEIKCRSCHKLNLFTPQRISQIERDEVGGFRLTSESA